MWRILFRVAAITRGAAAKFFRVGGPARKAASWLWKITELGSTAYFAYDIFNSSDDDSDESSSQNLIPPIILRVLQSRASIRHYRQLSTAFSRAGLTLLSCTGQAEQIIGSMYLSFSEYIDTYLSRGRRACVTPLDLKKRLAALSILDADVVDGKVSYPDPDDLSKMTSAPVEDFKDEVTKFLNSDEMKEVFATDDGYLIYDCFVFIREDMENLIKNQ